MSEISAANTNVIELKNMDMLYLQEYSRIHKVGGVNNPYAIMGWHGMQIPHAISTMLNDIGLRFNFVTNTDSYEEGDLYFYDRNPTRCGLDFAENPDQEEDFLRYAVELHCLYPVQCIAQYPLPRLEEISHGTIILINAVTQTDTQQRRDMDAALRDAGTSTNWFPNADAPCQKNLELNYLIGAEGGMSPGRILDPEGAKYLVISY